MKRIDWQELFASNQAAIARGGLAPRATIDLHQLPTVADRLPGAIPSLKLTAKNSHRALVHVPHRLDPAMPVPLVCMLHGCTQDPASFAAATLMNDAADKHGFVVVYPGQNRRDNAQGCWNWFLREHQRRELGEPAAIAAVVRDLIGSNAQFTVDPGRVFVAGLSSGGAMAAILGACYPDLFASVAVHSGLAYNSATSVSSAFDVMAGGAGDADVQGRAAHAAMGAHARPVPSIVIQGNADHTVVSANAINVLRQSMTANHLAAPETCDHNPQHPTSSWRGQTDSGHSYIQSRWTDRHGALMHELLMIDGLAHAWSGGAAGGSYSDPRGPSATEAICTFFAVTSAARPVRGAAV